MVEMEPAIENAILAHAEKTYPHECCGFLLGHAVDGVRVVTEARRAGNRRHDSPRNRYEIAPEEFLEVERETRRRDLAVLGFYHSHPDAEPVPSAHDREHAWPWYAYVIVPVSAGRASAPRAWTLKEDASSFEELEMRNAQRLKETRWQQPS